MTTLRDYQHKWKADIYGAWQEPNVLNVIATLPTGAGKTTGFADIVAEYNQPACLIAHRQELVSQAALTLNRAGIPHGIIAPRKIVQQIIALEHETHGYARYQYNSPVRVAGIDTLPGHDSKDRWLHQVALTVIDEGHHVLKANKWGKGFGMFPNARGLFPTAHALRADNKGLGRNAAGLADRLVVGPYCRQLIDRGYLTDYRLVCVGSDIDFSHVPIGSTGDYSLPQLRKATHESNRIVGDAVALYLQYAAGERGITFAVDIEAAGDYCRAYRAAGVPCEVITSKTPISVRSGFMKQLRLGQLLMLVSVDCLGEGVDVPAVKIIIQARKTASFQLYGQQCGRPLRPVIDDRYFQHWDKYTDEQRVQLILESEKPAAIIVDLVGNWAYFHDAGYGLFDSLQQYDLDGTGPVRTPPREPMTECTNCTRPYEKFRDECPYCNTKRKAPAGRTSPEMVDGDVIELDAAVLAALRANVDKIDAPPAVGWNPNDLVGRSIAKNHEQRKAAQQILRYSMMLWGGYQEQRHSTSEARRKFFHHYNIDYLSAQALGITDAMALNTRIRSDLVALNVPLTEVQHDQNGTAPGPRQLLEQSRAG